MARHKGQQVQALTRESLHARLQDLRQRERALLRRAHTEGGLITPTPQAQFTWAASDIPLEELWAEVHWTEEAAERIRADEYRYISPEFDMDHLNPSSGDRVGAALLAIGLVTRPFLKGMARVDDPDEDNVGHVQVFMTGEWHHEWYGKIRIEPKHLQEMLSNYRLLFSSVRGDTPAAPTEMVVDYNHMSLGGGPDDSRAAGWVRGDGLYVVRPQPQQATEPINDTPPPPQGGITMQDDRVRELLELEEGAEITVEHLQQALDVLDERMAATEAKLSEPPPADDLEQLRRQAAEGAEAMRKLKERDAEDAVRQAFDAGKITAAQQKWARGYALSDPQGFAAFVEGCEVVVETGKDSADTAAPAPVDVGAYVRAKVAEGATHGAACGMAVKEFGADAFNAWRFPNR